MGGKITHHDRRDSDDDQRHLGRLAKAQRNEQDRQERDWRDDRNARDQWPERGADRGQHAEDKTDHKRHQGRDAKPEPQALEAGQRIGPCLLYTSPSPRDRQKSRMPSSA